MPERLREAGDAPEHDWVDLEQSFPRLWTSLADELEVDSPDEAAEALDADGTDLAARVTGAEIVKDERRPKKGDTAPSDHAPVLIELD